jgi:hypothetical protein
VTGVVVLSTGWLVLHMDERSVRAEAPDARYAQLATEGPAVLRVRASLGAQLPARGGNGFLSQPRHYWVDVDVAGDGTLYIKGVTPIDDDPQLFVP